MASRSHQCGCEMNRGQVSESDTGAAKVGFVSPPFLHPPPHGIVPAIPKPHDMPASCPMPVPLRSGSRPLPAAPAPRPGDAFGSMAVLHGCSTRSPPLSGEVPERSAGGGVTARALSPLPSPCRGGSGNYLFFLSLFNNPAGANLPAALSFRSLTLWIADLV
jgi:hypothetical protein